MKKTQKCGITLSLLATAIVSSLFAQSAEIEMANKLAQIEEQSYSNTYLSTAHLIRTDMDKYLNLNYFNEVEMDKVFASTNISDETLQIGAATKINDIYLGGFYTGDLWGDLSGQNTKTETREEKQEYTNPDFITTITNNIYKDSLISILNDGNTHYFDVLLGLKNMGFKLSSFLHFGGGVEKFSNEGIEDSTNYKSENYWYDLSNLEASNPKKLNYKYFNDVYAFALNWGGMNIHNKNTLVKPSAGIGFIVYNNELNGTADFVNKYYDKEQQKYTTNKTANLTLKDKQNSFTSLLLNGGSEFIWGNETQFKQSLIANDAILINFYYENCSEQSITSVDNISGSKPQVQTITQKMDAKAMINNVLNLDYKFEYKPISSLTFSGRIGANTSFGFIQPGLKVQESYDNNGNYTHPIFYNYVYNETEETFEWRQVAQGDYIFNPKIFTTVFNPSFSIGLSYAIKPNLIINLGYEGELPTVTLVDKGEMTKTYSGSSASETIIRAEQAYTEISCKTGKFTSTLSAGLKWSISKYCDLDLAFLTNTRTPALSTLWSTGWNIGFTFKK